jgi:hypothetical protein
VAQFTEAKPDVILPAGIINSVERSNWRKILAVLGILPGVALTVMGWEIAAAAESCSLLSLESGAIRRLNARVFPPGQLSWR